MNRQQLLRLAKRVPGVDAAWSEFRRRQLLRAYRDRREHYAELSQQRGLVHREADVAPLVERRLAARGYTPPVRSPGEVHTFAFVPKIFWHEALYPDLHELGPVSAFDYAALGFTWEEFWKQDRRAAHRRREMNSLALQALKEAHARRPVDWVFVYASGLEVRRELIEAITSEVGVPVVSMCLDDKHCWTGPVFDGQRLGQIDIAPKFDLCWTSARVACEWYHAECAVPIYLPEGCDVSTFRPLNMPRDIPVSFIGADYGFRRAVARDLIRCGIPLQTFGRGWERGPVTVQQQVEIFNRSQINLGMGGIGYSEELTNLKGRDFEIPVTGGGAYLTSFNSDLAQHFHVGHEILCYRSRDELVELVRYYLAHPNEAREIARAGRDRCLREHRWLHRFERVCRSLGILASAGRIEKSERLAA
jgi:hypothetical protein